MFYFGVILAEVVVLFILVHKLHLGFARLFYKLTRSERLSAYLLAVLFLPGTFVHEVAHFLTALFLLVPVGAVDLFPKVDGESVRLGSVGVAKTDFIRRTFIGFAPVLFGIGILFGVTYFAISRELLITPLSYLVFFYVVFQVANTMFLSRRDLEGSWRVLVAIFVVIVAVYLLGIRVEIGSIIFSLGQRLEDILTKMSIFLSLPVIVDFVFVLIFKFVKII